MIDALQTETGTTASSAGAVLVLADASRFFALAPLLSTRSAKAACPGLFPVKF